MHAWNDYHPIVVQTIDGAKEISKLNLGDKVFSYLEPGTFTVGGVATREVTELFEVEYTDGRKSMFGLNDKIYLGMNTTITPRDIFEGAPEFGPQSRIVFDKPIGSFIQRPIDYGPLSTQHSHHPDPYTAGVLLTYGNYDRDEIMIPQWTYMSHEFIRNKCNLVYGNKMGDNGEMCFSRPGNEHIITWSDLFPYQQFFAKSHHLHDPLIPVDYQYASINDRWEYVRGVFDAGFNPKIFIDRVGIAHTSEKRLQHLQQMMWSIGIMSMITYEPNTCKERPWILTTVGKYQRYPGIFYHPKYIAWTLSRDNTIIDQQIPMMMQIVSIRYVTNGVIPNIAGESGWTKSFYDENFLPRISISV